MGGKEQVQEKAAHLLDTALFRRSTTPLVLQTEAAECGMACLAMVAGRYGYRIDLPALRSRYNVSLKGMTLHDMVRVAAELRLSTRALKADMANLDKLRLPCVLHWEHSHFVVLARVGRRSAVILDPALGRRTITLEDVSRRFTGVVLEAWPNERFERKTERARIRLTELVRRTHGITAAVSRVLSISVFLELLVLLTPIGFQLVLDEVIVSDDRDLLVLIALALGAVLGFRVLTDLVRSWVIMATGAQLTLQWKMSLFRHLMQLPLSFFERRHVGDVASRFTSLEAIEKTLTTGPISGLLDGFMSVGLLAILWIYDSLLAMLVLCVMVIYALIRGGAYRAYRLASEEAIIYGARENSHFVETLRGMPSIKALCIGDRRQACWNNYLVDHVGAELRLQKLDLLYRAANTLLFGLDRIIIIYLGARAVMAGSMSAGMLVAFLAYKDQFSQRIATLLDTLIRLKLLGLHGERIADIALAPPEDAAARRLLVGDDGTLARTSRASLAAREIGFRYGDNEPPVIAGFDFDVAPGECVAIVGPSGAGKTTLLKILAGLLQPTRGTVLLEGVPVQSLGLENYRMQIGCVLQDDRLFAGSIAENIAAFSPSYDPERIEEAARLAAIHDEILRMPMGYETLVGDMGSALSGGQVQRVVLARALYRRPRLLLLDEATSHLDEENERTINQAIRALPIARIIVAHRRSTIDLADRIVPLWPAQGRPTQGRSDQL